ncbi:MAG: ABC transporter substrate-binding protein [Phycisphaerae bacterium]|nr:ABC transporter substrate-binding protein [Tepidisphaeraceae bacterium]
MKIPLLFACVLGCLVAPAARAQNEIVIGHFGSLTGGTATFGTSTKEGIDLAVKEINDAGGVLGKKIRVVHEDDQSKSEQATAAVFKLINQDKVVALIGEVASTRSLAAAPTAQRSRVPMLSPASTNPKVTQTGDYIFRSCFIDPFQGAAMADFLMKSDKGPKVKRVAVLYDVRNDYSTGLREFFTNTVKAGGGQIVADEAYGEGDTDFRAQLTKIKQANPEAIYVPGYYTEIGLIARQARDLGVNVPLCGGDGWDSEKLFEGGGAAINGCYFTNHYSAQEERPAVRKFVADYKAMYGGKTPDAMAILGYDAMRIMADAITRAGNTRGKAVRDALAATKDFPAASGTITIDKDRNAQKPIVVLKVQDGKTSFLTSVDPGGAGK